MPDGLVGPLVALLIVVPLIVLVVIAWWYHDITHRRK